MESFHLSSGIFCSVGCDELYSLVVVVDRRPLLVLSVKRRGKGEKDTLHALFTILKNGSDARNEPFPHQPPSATFSLVCLFFSFSIPSKGYFIYNYYHIISQAKKSGGVGGKGNEKTELCISISI